MANRKNKKADKPMYGGCVTFDGNINVLINGQVKTLRTDLGGCSLKNADPNKELLVLLHEHITYDEIDTGYIVRAKNYDKQEWPLFGLKNEPDADNWPVFKYCDVIAWGYADGGLNDPTLFYSCQSTIDEEIEREKWRAEHGRMTHAEELAVLKEEAEWERTQQGFVLKYRHKDGKVETETSWPMKPELLDKVKKYMEPTLANFLSFTHDQPDVKEVHYFTEVTRWDADDETAGNAAGTVTTEE